MKHIVALVTLAFLLTGCGGGSSTSTTSDARYKITFHSDWTADNFPTGFPGGKEHFSGLVGATHTKSSSIWKRGSKSSSGMKLMAETGKKDALKSEIASSSAFTLVDGGGITLGSNSVSLEFSTSKDKPLLTLTSMVAPSPDWFVGISGINLYDESEKEWIATMTIALKIYDAGTDSGTTFTSANAATSPVANISLLTEPEVDISSGVHGVSAKSIGTLTIERL